MEKTGNGRSPCNSCESKDRTLCSECCEMLKEYRAKTEFISHVFGSTLSLRPNGTKRIRPSPHNP